MWSYAKLMFSITVHYHSADVLIPYNLHLNSEVSLNDLTLRLPYKLTANVKWYAIFLELI
jgi:hypothetical protein